MLYALHLRCAAEALLSAVFHSRAHHAAPRLRLAKCCAYDSPFWGQKPVIVLYRRFIKRGYFWPKKDMRHCEKLPWKCVPPPPAGKVKSGTICFNVQHHGLTLFFFSKDPCLMLTSALPVFYLGLSTVYSVLGTIIGGEVPTPAGILNRFWIQVAASEAKRPPRNT
jgi:hypothetical protein